MHKFSPSERILESVYAKQVRSQVGRVIAEEIENVKGITFLAVVGGRGAAGPFPESS
jgi:hypothetical protein